MIGKIKDQKPKVKYLYITLQKVSLVFCYFLLIIFLFLNIFTSQQISSLYFQIANNQKTARLKFLVYLRSSPLFEQFYQVAKNSYGQGINEVVFDDKIKLQNQIFKMQKLLQLNPKQKNILYNLYLLYQLKNTNLAREYLHKAQLIDPMIK